MPSLARSSIKAIQFANDEWRYRRVYRKYKELTMIGQNSYIGNLRLAARAREIPGSIVECGTWRGGMIAGIADVLGGGRRYYLFDSFQGLPPAKEVDGPAAFGMAIEHKWPVLLRQLHCV
jgi:O-methyltransferase